MQKKKIKSAEILCVGTELLMGHTLNTNSGYIALQLAELGIPSYRQIVIGDNPARLLEQIKESAAGADLVILTGGLGPTKDDITMEVAAEAAGKKRVLHQPSLAHIESFFQGVGRPMTENNKKQAMFPEDAQVFSNTNGTAPGAIFSCPAPTAVDPSHEALLALLPGPPSEMKPMFTLSLRPLLESMAPYHLRSEYVHIIGVGESAAETRIMDLIDKQENPTIAPYAAEGECMFRITQRLDSDADPDLIAPVIGELKERFGDNIYEVGTRSLKEVVVDLLNQKNKSISLAESCTAGMLSSVFGDVPGVSSVFSGAVVAYGNHIKESVLEVPSGILEKDGAVSEACACAMAEGCRRLMKTDIALSVTGIAGPDGGTEKKPVGLIYIAICDGDKTTVQRFDARGNRMRIRRVVTLAALNMIRNHLL